MGKELPKGWVEKDIKSLLDFVIGGDWGEDPDKNSSDEYTTVYCVRGSEIKNWEREKGITSVIRRVKSSSLEKRKLQIGDVLLEISGGGPDQPVGRTVVIDNKVINSLDLPLVCTNFLRLLRFRKEINGFYANYFFKSFYLSGEIVKYQGGSNNLRNLKYKEFETIKLPFPALSEQKRIVAKLDQLFSHLETAKKGLEKIPVLLKQFRQAVLTQAVTGENYELRTIESITNKVGSGSTPSGGQNSYQDQGIPLVRSMNIHFNGIKNDGLAFLNEKQAHELRNVTIEEDDVLLNITGASIGRVCIAESHVVGGRVNQHVSIVRANREIIIPQYLNIALSSPIVQKYINDENYGVTRQALTKSQLLNLEIAVPKLKEQTEIVRRVEALFAKADAIEARYKVLKEKIDNLPQAVLAKAFRGEM